MQQKFQFNNLIVKMEYFRLGYVEKITASEGVFVVLAVVELF